MAIINNVTMVGRMASDAQLRTTQNGKSVTTITLAVDNYGKDAGASFIECVVWAQPAEFIAKYGGKGKLVAVSGRIQSRSYEDKDGNKRKAVEVITDALQLLDRNDKAEQPQGDTIPTNTDDDIDLSEIPF